MQYCAHYAPPVNTTWMNADASKNLDSLTSKLYSRKCKPKPSMQATLNIKMQVQTAGIFPMPRNRSKPNFRGLAFGEKEAALTQKCRR